jgi:hypothetical protein
VKTGNAEETVASIFGHILECCFSVVREGRRRETNLNGLDFKTFARSRRLTAWLCFDYQPRVAQ